ncbi:protein phosphatase 1 regulatory subunit 3C-B [Thunnus maccoyii]|uniref:protein phosphatase 1 regulatory subunit 3C-B n=1 Tax=Thunnus maccoyii TaxID=8240 RepID=UPI001C4D05F8|nr:protein phosphatase 1 regulatory subunit 3C-B [Thunnus maccoyii]XP_042250172.1 protein phosphatase 1 regulatory subunit 3C-B [Thunnus maccoyii]
MSCTRVLHAFGSHSQPAVMPLDLTMCLTLSRRQPLYQLLSMSPLTPTQHCYQPTDCSPRTGFHSSHSSSSSSSSSSLPFSPMPSEPRSCFRRDSSGLHKKRVVFADAKGLALTAVRLFNSEPSSRTSTLLMKPSPAKLQDQQLTSNKLQRYKLRLGFPQPTLDFKAFLARLQEMRVQLESCNISEQSLSGKVCVSHASIEKVVHIRVTFDSWRSYHDIPCTFLQQQRCWSSEMEIFAFDIILPKNIDPKERIEFCVSFRPGPGTTPHWDNNRGQNYRVCMAKDGSNANQGDTNRYNPTLSKHRPPSWPSHGALGIQNDADLQYPPRSFSKRVKAECKTLCSTK